MESEHNETPEDENGSGSGPLNPVKNRSVIP
jgi:hypothetical protein